VHLVVERRSSPLSTKSHAPAYCMSPFGLSMRYRRDGNVKTYVLSLHVFTRLLAIVFYWERQHLFRCNYKT